MEVVLSRKSNLNIIMFSVYCFNSRQKKTWNLYDIKFKLNPFMFFDLEMHYEVYIYYIIIYCIRFGFI